ncbi:DUF992 domain-containing protein [Oceaniglobus roseus]|uniref:DUF992 domain-containing protein n=1 Tax=Oceaniglobus roseus TaxID=1737570 RepID=UPI000C7EDEB3|nr:DUF992 domain-containing protein [Kandeliimicrobium roseum]
MSLSSKSAIAAAVLSLSVAAPALAQVKVETVETGSTLGYLECTVEGGFGLLVGSSRDMVCTFSQEGSDNNQTYVGQIDKLGLDIGIRDESYMKWVVVQALDRAPEDLTLEGTYVGVSADASVGLGLGANALIGGSQDSIALQPFSVEGQTGLNLAVGLSRLTLVAVQ